ncbi:Uncharacterized protein OBRU01_02539 [Operophtera brumata]|uniref:Uncharacterized protein n=1 Tax=Operophtera brumata TaxID=104452 RepID=A0A0L7LPL7_OPEBR|nr:Uncharacterized protein OBRU01_02539 [Operophtera brumata]
MGAIASRYRVSNSGLTSADIQTIENDSKRGNPGTLDELHKKSKDVMPVNFEGGKLMVNRGLSNHFQLGATYIGTKQISPTEAFPVLLGDVDPSGNVNMNVIHQLTPEVRVKGAAQVGMVDSNWNIGAVLEKKLQPLPFTFALSGMANQGKQQFKFGCGLIIG